MVGIPFGLGLGVVGWLAKRHGDPQRVLIVVRVFDQASY